MTKDEVYQKIAEASLFGNLGLFIGAGFSKAVFQEVTLGQPLTWIQLLECIAQKNDIDWNTIDKSYHNCPEIASLICKMISNVNRISIKDAEKRIKEQICNITSWYPSQAQRNIYSAQLTYLNPKWIITTNYDLIIEGLLPDNTNSLGPNDSLVFSNYTIPVYHMHGIRTNANSLIITNEDYIKLFRPNDYRLHKLSLTINESTTLLMGYGVGDPNVLTALDWSKNVYQNNKTHYPNGIIQLVYNENPSDIPIETDEGMVLLETNSIVGTIGFVNQKINENRQRYQASLTEITTLRNHLVNADDTILTNFITDGANRKLYLTRISNDYRYIIESFLSFLAKVFDRCWERAKPRNAFHAYNEMIAIVLDTIIEISYEKMSPALFETIASNLERSSYYIGKELGKSRAAYNLWHHRRGEIPEIMKKELCYYAQQYGSYRIEQLFQ